VTDESSELYVMENSEADAKHAIAHSLLYVVEGLMLMETTSGISTRSTRYRRSPKSCAYQ